MEKLNLGGDTHGGTCIHRQEHGVTDSTNMHRRRTGQECLACVRTKRVCNLARMRLMWRAAEPSNPLSTVGAYPVTKQ